MSLYNDASLVMIPSAVKDGRIYSIRPVPEFGNEILTQPIDIDTDFNANAGGVIVDANTFTTSGGSADGIISSSLIQANKQYRLEIQGTTTSNGFTFGNGGTGSGNEYGAGFGVHYFTAAHQTLWFRQNTAGTTDITTFSIKEVTNIGDFTFSRGSNLAATRVDENGLIEKGRENLLLQSNQFDTTWTKSGGITLTSGQVGYDGTNNAWLVERSAAYNNLYQSNSSFFTPVSTISVYAKAGTYNFLRLAVAGVGEQVYFNLTDGSVGVNSELIASSSQSIGNGWWRLSATFQDNSASGIYIQPVETDGGIANAGTGSIYIQDAQLEAGLVATDYIETTTTTSQAGILEDMPRLDYSGGASCPALLLEPTRTNILTYSEYFDSAFWTNDVGTTLTTNAGISPDGNQNATRFESPLSTKGLFTYGAVNNQTISIYIKAGNTVNIGKSVTLFTSTISQSFVLTDEWQRISVSGSASNLFALYPTSGDGVNAFIWGAQAESNASYPTSYIPCYGAATTRSVDDAVATHTLTDNQTLSYFTEFIAPEGASGGGEHLLENSLGQSRIRIYQNNNNDSIRIRTDLPSANFDYTYSSLGISAGDIVKICLRVDNGVMTAFINGVEKNTFGAATINFERLHLRPVTNININNTSIFPTALTDSEAIALTTI